MITIAFLTLFTAAAQDKNPGYADTPRLPGQEWRVHDSKRPRPRIVTPDNSKFIGRKAPENADYLNTYVS